MHLRTHLLYTPFFETSLDLAKNTADLKKTNTKASKIGGSAKLKYYSGSKVFYSLETPSHHKRSSYALPVGIRASVRLVQVLSSAGMEMIANDPPVKES